MQETSRFTRIDRGAEVSPGASPGGSKVTRKAVTVRLQQDGLWGDTRIESESLKSTRPNADMAEWSVSVPANGKTEVTAVFDSTY